MAGSSLLTLIDDIATLLDDVSAMASVTAKKTAFAAKKTAGVLGDDLALNAEQVSGVRAERELPVIGAHGAPLVIAQTRPSRWLVMSGAASTLAGLSALAGVIVMWLTALP